MSNYIPFILIPFIGWGVRRFLIRKDDWTPLKQRTLAIGIGAYFITEMARSFYRPYIYAHDINDYFIADTVGNSFGTITALFMVLTMAGKGTTQDWQLVGLILAGLLGYEALNLFTNHPFDWADIIATLIFGAGSAWLYAWLIKRY